MKSLVSGDRLCLPPKSSQWIRIHTGRTRLITTGISKSVNFSELLSMKFLSSGTTRTFTTSLTFFSALVATSMIFHHHQSDSNQFTSFAEARVLDDGGRLFPNVTKIDTNDSDKLLGGLLASGFDEDSCLSRYQSVLYRKLSPYKPSPYLISKLRNYEMLHKRCGPGTESYKKGLKQLDQKHIDGNDINECKYVVWVSFSGLGNRMLSLASVFLYALLTDRVLLVDQGKDMDYLFCEPFLGMSWLLPLDFPMTTDQIQGLNQESSSCYGYMVKNKAIDAEKTLSHLYLHLVHDYGDYDKMFFCEEDQTVICKVPWLIVKTNNYFVPSLWLIPGFEDELNKLFPEKATVFHHLGRYLFHPTNQVWGLVTRYYEAYLSHADEKIGIQVRVFEEGVGPFQHVIDQISSCTLKEKLLPQVIDNTLVERSLQQDRRISKLHKAVLITSLNAGYSENLKSMYWEYPTSTGEVISVHQPSQEVSQQSEKKMHNGKALAEIYLLSMTDNLVTSAWSTFGYVAQGLGGLKPWLLYKPENRTAPDPACVRAMSMEPCFHAPPTYDCKAKKFMDTGKLVPHVRHCEDISWGLKLV